MKIKILINSLLFISLVGFLPGCKSKTPANVPAEAEKKITIPPFNADSAYAFVAAQVAFGPRVPSTKAHALTATYLEKILASYADEVLVQSFQATTWDKKTHTGYNIIGRFRPEATQRVLLAAHWDSRPTADHDPDAKNHHAPVLGANDGASGVGILLELARMFKSFPQKIGIDIIFFDLEDYGTPEFADVEGEDHSWCLGSQYWANNPHVPGYRAQYGILLDMVGGSNPKFTKEAVSMYYAPDVMNKVWEIAQVAGYGDYFSNEETGGITDDHLYVNKYANIPMIDIIHYDPHTDSRFPAQWHTLQDNMDHIDKNTLDVVGKTVLHVIYQHE